MKVGDVCEYRYHDCDNRSRTIVRIKSFLNDDPNEEAEYAEIEFLKILIDDSGNGLFEYLFETGKTMYASLEYLHKIEDCE